MAEPAGTAADLGHVPATPRSHDHAVVGHPLTHATSTQRASCYQCFLSAVREENSDENRTAGHFTWQCVWETTSRKCLGCAQIQCLPIPKGIQGDWQVFNDILDWGYNAHPGAMMISTIGPDYTWMDWGHNAIKAIHRESRILARVMVDVIQEYANDNGYKLSSDKKKARLARLAYDERMEQKRANRIRVLQLRAGITPTLAKTLIRLEPGDSLFPVVQAGIRSFFMGVALGAIADGEPQYTAELIRDTWQCFGDPTV
ncbi:hypothetical protein N7468_009233 [Penicillium chermesinum]|uniref:Uncharacterized protein n=1 Tax=Penicillium chermesinum TaxID=63820 RepID=A0A9W9NJX2_9EURO|nr:uncharacterized protein N7468_009233 [Penicillium chermesinum]KAJ5220029.1 hypothetical protein N7468_009233 [Penicillium chermesinum]KAJ6157482.1 hypothetical protein N7470_005074 [Penicillium chermesinum]